MKKAIGFLFALILLGAGVALIVGSRWINSETAPTPSGPVTYIRFERPAGQEAVLAALKEKGIIRNVDAFQWMTRLQRIRLRASRGTYEVHPGMTSEEVIATLKKPIRRMVRIPETNWAQRTANLLEQKYQVGSADEYMRLVRSPAEFKDIVSFPLPSDSLEGYLFPDTYDLPPLTSAREVIIKQLRAFESKVWEDLEHPKDLRNVLTKASMVELETGTEADRPNIAGEIENRLKKHMRLQIDATILYGMQEWRALTRADYRLQKNPYNTYLIDGLPPGPICSPSLASIKAVLNPALNDYLYHVALPDGSSLFASTFDEHRKNIKKRKLALGATR